MPVIPYIHFSGDCAEAMTFYATVLGAPPPVMMRYRDTPDPDPTMKDSDLVMHCEIQTAGGALMASDFPPGMTGERQQGMSVMYGVASAAEGRRVFDQLSSGGGSTIMDYGPTFWSTGFGMVKDRFGTHWMIAAPGPEAAD
jgi:PhnB protein